MGGKLCCDQECRHHPPSPAVLLYSCLLHSGSGRLLVEFRTPDGQTVVRCCLVGGWGLSVPASHTGVTASEFCFCFFFFFKISFSDVDHF